MQSTLRLIFIFISLIGMQASFARPSVALCMIAKDEQNIIKELLSSVSPYIDKWVLVDTGSSDNTISVVKEFFAAQNIEGKVYQRKWHNFGHNRSEALALCRSEADFSWMMDADDVLHGEIDFSKLDTNVDAYKLFFKLKESSFWRYQVFNNNANWEYKGVLHEAPHLNYKPKLAKLEGNYYVEARSAGSRSKRANKYNSDIKLLEDGIQSDPNNPIYWFYLGANKLKLGSYTEAIKAHKASKQHIQNQVNRPKQDIQELVYANNFHIALAKLLRKDSYKQIQDAFITAYESRKIRLEPVYYLLANANHNNDYKQAEFWANVGSSISMPKQETLLVYNSIYEYLFDIEKAIFFVKTKNHGKAMSIINSLSKKNIPPDIRFKINEIKKVIQQ